MLAAFMRTFLKSMVTYPKLITCVAGRFSLEYLPTHLQLNEITRNLWIAGAEQSCRWLEREVFIQVRCARTCWGSDFIHSFVST